jgi:hypothetical protein
VVDQDVTVTVLTVLLYADAVAAIRIEAATTLPKANIVAKC